MPDNEDGTGPRGPMAAVCGGLGFTDQPRVAFQGRVVNVPQRYFRAAPG